MPEIASPQACREDPRRYRLQRAAGILHKRSSAGDRAGNRFCGQRRSAAPEHTNLTIAQFLRFGYNLNNLTSTTRKRGGGMVRIAVCDDSGSELHEISALAEEYLSAGGTAGTVRSFSHPDELLQACETNVFHIYLLDMVMPMLSGLELGRGIRRRSADAQIIFITSEPAFALDAYAVTPLHYLLKPVRKDALFSALELAVKKVNNLSETAVTIRTRDGLRTLSADEIACCEYVRHSVVYTLTDGERTETLSLRESFAEHIAPLLRDRRFLQPHAAFAVNMSCAERLDKTGFVLRGGALVPVSGKLYAAVRDAYMKYRLGEGA